MKKLSKTAHKAVTVISLLTKALMNPLSDTKGASKALTHHPDHPLVIALSSCLLKHPSSIELLSKWVLPLCIMCSGPVQASRLGNPNPVLNVHETYLPHHCCSICPPEAHQPLSLGQLLPTYPPEVHLTPSLGPHTCLPWFSGMHASHAVTRLREIITDSRYVKEGLTTHLQHWEDQGWIGIKNAKLFQKVAYLLRCQSVPTTFTWVKSHRGNQGNEESDRLAKEGANKQTPDELDLDVPDEFNIQGEKLRTITQALAYRGIMEKRLRLTREGSEENIGEARRAIAMINKSQETAETIWTNLKKPVLRHRVQQFLFKAMHNAYIIGSVWNEIPDHQDWVVCTACNKTESMWHILLNCQTTPNGAIWDQARWMWQHEPAWPEISLGTI